MKTIIYILPLLLLLFAQCKSSQNLIKNPVLEEVALDENENSAIFLGINKVDIFKINGMEFYHTFLIILTKNPWELSSDFTKRLELFYDVQSRNNQRQDVVYFDSFILNDRQWETTISSSSECANDTTSKNLGNLIKVPNYDRVDNSKSGQRVFVKKIASDNLAAIERLLSYESLYNDSLKYALVPEVSVKGYNSNSFTRGALQYAGLFEGIQFPNCFKTPGFSKPVSMVTHKTR